MESQHGATHVLHLRNYRIRQYQTLLQNILIERYNHKFEKHCFSFDLPTTINETPNTIYEFFFTHSMGMTSTMEKITILIRIFALFPIVIHVYVPHRIHPSLLSTHHFQFFSHLALPFPPIIQDFLVTDIFVEIIFIQGGLYDSDKAFCLSKVSLTSLFIYI